MNPSDRVVVTLNLDDAVKEMNVINKFLESRWNGLSDRELYERSAVQIIAMGLLVSKWMEKNPKDVQDAVTSTVKQLSKQLLSTIDMAQG